MLVKIRNREYDLDADDVFMDNGYCFQLLTRRVNLCGTKDFPETLKVEYLRKWLSEGILEPIGQVHGCYYYRLSDKVVKR